MYRGSELLALWLFYTGLSMVVEVAVAVVVAVADCSLSRDSHCVEGLFKHAMTFASHHSGFVVCW